MSERRKGRGKEKSIAFASSGLGVAYCHGREGEGEETTRTTMCSNCSAVFMSGLAV